MASSCPCCCCTINKSFLANGNSFCDGPPTLWHAIVIWVSMTGSLGSTDSCSNYIWSGQMELVIDDCRINFTDAFKLLGVIIDKDLNFSQHISEVCIKISKMIGVLQRLKNLIPMNAKLRKYKTAVLPHLTYCSLVWHFCRASDRNKLERINERGLRTVFKDWVSPYSDLLTHAGMTSLYNMRLQDIAIFMFKIRNRSLPYNILELFSPSPSNYNLRN